MSDQLKPLPTGVQSYPSAQVYQQYCQSEAQSRKGSREESNFSLDKTLVLDTNPRDKNLELNFQDPEENFFCAAQWSLDNHEMYTVAGTLEPHTIQSEGVLPMKDACSLYQSLVPEPPLCQDSFVSPQLSNPEVSGASTFQKYLKYCQGKLQERSQTLYGSGPVLPLTAQRIEVFNPSSLDPYWFFRYQSPGQDFFCEGVADFKVHRMHLRSGPYGQEDRIPYEDNFHMSDACSLTEALFGGEKFLGKKCVDKSESEVQREYYTAVGFNLLVSGLAIVSSYKFSKWFIRSAWTALRPSALPFLENAFTRFMPLWEALYGLENSAAAFFTLPIAEVGWAGRLGWLGVSFYAGYKTGGLIDQIPKIFGGKNISEYAADGLYAAFGKAPDWMVDATDWVTGWF